MSELYRCTPRQARAFVRDIIYAGLVPFLQSSPGMGKSSIMRSVAEEDHLQLIDHRLSTSAPEDLSGLPEFYDTPLGRRARFVPFGDLFPLQGVEPPEGKQGWMLFLDEFNSAAKTVQAAAYKLILDRMLGQHHLSDRVVVCAAGNLATDRAIVNPLSTAMQSRVVHLVMEPKFEDWLYDVAFKQNYDTRIIAYLSQYPSKLMDFRPDHQDKTFCCPRTWEFVNKLISKNSVSDETAMLLAGTITSGTAADFVQFCKIYTKVITLDAVLKDPENCALPDTQNMRWATVSSLMEKIDEQNFEKVSKYVDRFTLDFRVMFYRSTMVRFPKMRMHPAMISALAGLGRYLAG